jgi:heme exporter protein C
VSDYHAICSDAIKIIDDRNIEIAFTVPNHLPDSVDKGYTSLIINSDNDGSAVSPDAVAVYKDSVDLPQVARTWGDCPVSNLFENDKYDYPFRTILYESIRNLYFHVPMWFGMILIFIASVIYSIRYLMNKKPLDDIKAKSYAQVGILYGVLGIITGGIWAQYTWGAFWSFDIKQNMSAIALLIYMAYFVLRGSFDDFEKRARLGAVYNIFAFATLIPLLFVIPRLYESLHPGNGGNPGFGGEDLDNTMRTVFYPAVIGWTLLGLWIGNLVYRLNHLKWKNFEDDDF